MFGLFRSAGPVTLSPAEAHARAGRGEVLLVDVREANEWAQSRVPGAVHAPLSTLAATVASLPADKPIVFYCLSGGRSGRAVDLCRKLGLPHETHVGGGISAWKAEGLPVER
ncbi:rhodanese-like domain-containing protein [Methyloraptor flagellatus]|uniref:Rhodanese-like domain-containing protein n=1 Tax=Methyloraptor flagellatus TaxID=3162530 RepID=A0AAU7XDP3_9HYPH